jgi:hypothetical protein
VPPARKPLSRKPKEHEPFPAAGLAELGLAEGDPVRFRRREGEHWKDGTVARRENDGSLGVHDLKGALLSLPLDLVEVKGTGPRGGVMWEPLPERAARTEQMKLL